MDIKLVKDGKSFNLETSKVIAICQWFVNYKWQRRKLYQTAKGTFFEVTEYVKKTEGCLYPTTGITGTGILLTDGEKSRGLPYITVGALDGTFRNNVGIENVEVSSILTEKQVRDKYEYTAKGGVYAMSRYAKAGYKFLVSYEELFEVEEA